jgi:hypothetical protein
MDDPRSRRVHRRPARPAAPAAAPSRQPSAVFPSSSPSGSPPGSPSGSPSANPSANPSATSAACKASAEERNRGSMWDSWLARMERIQPRRLNLIMSCSFCGRANVGPAVALRDRCRTRAQARGPFIAPSKTVGCSGAAFTGAGSAPGSERASARPRNSTITSGTGRHVLITSSLFAVHVPLVLRVRGRVLQVRTADTVVKRVLPSPPSGTSSRIAGRPDDAIATCLAHFARSSHKQT